MPCDTSVEDVMSAPPIAAPSSTSVLEVARLMKMYGVGSVVVLEDRRPIGLFTDRELVWLVATIGCESLSHPIGRYAMRSFPVVRKDTCVREAAQLIIGMGARHAVVVDSYGFLVGVVSLKDIALKLSRLGEEEKRSTGEVALEELEG